MTLLSTGKLLAEGGFTAGKDRKGIVDMVIPSGSDNRSAYVEFHDNSLLLIPGLANPSDRLPS